jgi:hypothetical protein
MFRSDDELKLIYEQLHNMVNHIAQAEVGIKFMPGEKTKKRDCILQFICG